MAVMTSQQSECNRKGEGGTRDFLNQRSNFCPEHSEEDPSLSYCVGVVGVAVLHQHWRRRRVPGRVQDIVWLVPPGIKRVALLECLFRCLYDADCSPCAVVPLQKWSKGKVREKLNNLVCFDQATYDKMMKEVSAEPIPKTRFMTCGIWLAVASYPPPPPLLGCHFQACYPFGDFGAPEDQRLPRAPCHQGAAEGWLHQACRQALLAVHLHS